MRKRGRAKKEFSLIATSKLLFEILYKKIGRLGLNIKYVGNIKTNIQFNTLFWLCVSDNSAEYNAEKNRHDSFRRFFVAKKTKTQISRN